MNYYLTLADLFSYPESGMIGIISNCKIDMTDKHAEFMPILNDFEEHCSKHNTGELQEYYSKTFDVGALCCMDIGYVIFGEDYKRGEFLVNMKAEFRKFGMENQIELADYLPNVLRLIYHHDDKRFVEEIAYCITIPALKEIINEFRSPDNIYRKLLQMVLNVLTKDFSHCDMEQINISLENDKNAMCKTCKV